MSETGLHVTGVPSREWGYNTRGELIAEDAPGTSFDRGYSFDGIGNRLRTAVNTTNTTTATGADLGTYFASSGGAAGANPVNQYGQVALPGQAPVAVVHDLDGNMTSGPLPSAPGSVSHFSWDAENRLTQVTVGGGGGTVSYRYDPFGRRIARILGNITELTLYDGWNPVAEYANTPQSTTISLKRTFVWGLDVSGSLQGAGGVGGLLAIREAAGNGSSKAGQAIFPAYDGNGNIIRLFNSNGATVASYAYDGFGNRINPAASDIDGSGYANENRYGFSTKPRDPLTGLLYYGYRWYDPATGRWASRDPINEQGSQILRSPHQSHFPTHDLNSYGFVAGDPISVIDLFGFGFLNTFRKAMTGALSGALTGALVGALVGGVPGAIAGAIGGAVGGAVAGAMAPDDATNLDIVVNGAVAGLVAGITGGIGGPAGGLAVSIPRIGAQTVMSSGGTAMIRSSMVAAQPLVIHASQRMVASIAATATALASSGRSSSCCEMHHIATNKNFISPARGGPWSPVFALEFLKVGMSLWDISNLCLVCDIGDGRRHRGPHPEDYHREILDRIKPITSGPGGVVSKQMKLRVKLAEICSELNRPGNLRNLVTK